ncbi:glycosyltransferase [Vibrio sp. RC27]
MRVAVVVNCLKMGGMERVAVNLADAFAKDNHDSHLIYLKDRKIELRPRNQNVIVQLFNLKKWVLGSGIGAIWFLICKLINAKYRKTFPHYFAYAEAKAFAYLLKQSEKQYGKFDLIIFRGQGTFDHIWPIQDDRFVFVCENVQHKTMYQHKSTQIFADLFNERHMVCVSDGAKESLDDLLVTHNIAAKSVTKISNPNDFELIRQESDIPIPTDVAPERPYILGLGRLTEVKNFPLLIEAYALLKQEQNLPHQLIIVGAGKDKETIERTIERLGLQDDVILKGQQSNPYPWFKQADLFVLSSRWEGLGMVLIEALVCGTPVVATDCKGGVRDIMQGGLEPYLTDETPRSLADKIATTLENPEVLNFQKDVAPVLQNFEQGYIVQQYLSTFAN